MQAGNCLLDGNCEVCSLLQLAHITSRGYILAQGSAVCSTRHFGLVTAAL